MSSASITCSPAFDVFVYILLAVIRLVWFRVYIILGRVDPLLAVFPSGYVIPLKEYLATAAEITSEISRDELLLYDLDLHQGDGFIHYVRTIAS